MIPNADRMPARNKFIKFALLPVFLLVLSCVKDVDLDQYEEITIPPTAALDLIFFTLTSEDFIDNTGEFEKATDDVRLEFLDDEYIQNGLVEAWFNFRFTNSFAQPFTATFRFLSESSALMHTIIIEIPAGGGDTPAVIDYSEIISGSNINRIRNSIQLEVEIEIHPNSAPVEGELQLESRAYYTFDF